MFRKTFSFGGLLLLAGAAVLVVPSVSQAQHGGGGRGGGGSYGGYRGGISHGGGYNGGNRVGSSRGGAYYGGNRGGTYRGTGYYGGYGYPYARSGYRSYYPNYGSYGYSYPYYYDTYPYSGYSSSYGNVAPSYADGSIAAAPSAGTYQALYRPATGTAQSDTSAHVTVKVPADAQVWFDNTATTSTGAVRQYDSPPLTPGSRLTYDVRARWNDNGKEVTQRQQVEVRPGANVHVDFPVPPKTADQPTVPPNP